MEGADFENVSRRASTRNSTYLYSSSTTASFDLSTFSTMECSFALTGKGYVIVAADTTAALSIVKMKVDEDKIKALSPHLLMAYSGEPGASFLDIMLRYD
jgi:hypothetical protein